MGILLQIENEMSLKPQDSRYNLPSIIQSVAKFEANVAFVMAPNT